MELAEWKLVKIPYTSYITARNNAAPHVLTLQIILKSYSRFRYVLIQNQDKKFPKLYAFPTSAKSFFWLMFLLKFKGLAYTLWLKGLLWI